MKRRIRLSAVALFSSLAFSVVAHAQGHVFTPASSLPQPRNASGERMASTTLRLFVPSSTQMHFGAKAIQPYELPPLPGYLYETPASLACIYDLVSKPLKGCNPNSTTVNASGGSKAIAIVDAFDDPTALSDLETYAAQFGLPIPKLSVVYASGSEPGEDPTGGWEIEESLDLDMALAFAPDAHIYLVEATDNSFANLFNAVRVASGLVAEAGGGEVSMSWGTGEFSSETSYDSYFKTSGVVYFAGVGDSPGTIYPSVSPNVVAAGGTSISRSLVTGDYVKQVTWQDEGGGQSLYETRPAFQSGVVSVVGSERGVPDLSFEANPTSGVWVYDSNPVYGTGWFVVGGSSVAAPSLAAIINAAGGFAASSQAENTAIYTNATITADYTDITYGNCGIYNAYFALKGYDLCTGNGIVKGLKGK